MALRCFPDLCVRDVPRSAEGYRAVFDLDVRIDHGWYAELGTPEQTLVAFVERDHVTVPPPGRRAPAGVLITFEVDDPDLHYRRAIAAGWQIVLEVVSV